MTTDNLLRRVKLGDIEQIIRLAEMANRNRVFLEKIGAVNEAFARNALLLEQSSAAMEVAIQPALRTIASLSVELARTVEPCWAAFDSISSWQLSLAARMEALTSRWWLQDYLSNSLMGFARMSRLSDAVHTPEPYAAPVVELVGEELGSGYQIGAEDTASKRDEAAVRAGLNPDLIAFPPDAYDGVVEAAGFSFCITPISPPQIEGSVDHGADFNPTPRQLFTALEQHLRHVVEKTLTKEVGRKWIKQRIPKDMRWRWEERREQDRAPGRPVYSAIQYADFMDLRDVICREDNWRDGFQPIFRNRNDLSMSFYRLHPVRRAIGHNRPLGRADVLTLFAEATRIFSALGIQILKQ